MRALVSKADLESSGSPAERRFEKHERQSLDAERVAHFGTWEWDPVADVSVWSDGLYRILGLDPTGVRPSLAAYLDRVLPEDRPAVNAHIGGAFLAGQNIDYDNRIVRPDGSVRIIRNFGALMFDESGAITRVVGVTQDITERREAELDALEKERRLRDRLARSAREMRALSARLQTIREEEGTRVAREVHDEIGQALTALGLDVAWLAHNLNRQESRETRQDGFSDERGADRVRHPGTSARVGATCLSDGVRHSNHMDTDSFAAPVPLSF